MSDKVLWGWPQLEGLSALGLKRQGEEMVPRIGEKSANRSCGLRCMNGPLASVSGKKLVEGINTPGLPSFILQSLTLASHSVTTRGSQKERGLDPCSSQNRVEKERQGLLRDKWRLPRRRFEFSPFGRVFLLSHGLIIRQSLCYLPV